MKPLNILTLNSADTDFDDQLQALLDRSHEQVEGVEDVVEEIIADIRRRGDAALLEYTQRFDGLSVSSVSGKICRQISLVMPSTSMS